MGRPRKSAGNPTDYSFLVPAVEQGSRILLALARQRSGRMTLTEVCKVVGIHPSKAYSILNTLQRFAFVQRDSETKAYSLGLGLVFLSKRALDSLDLPRAAAPFLRALANQTNSTAFLGLVSDSHLYVAAKDEGDQEFAVGISLGQRFRLAWGAHGKAIIPFLSREEREKIMGMEKDESKYGPAVLEQEMATYRKTGYAVDVIDTKSGIRAVASSVYGPGAKLIGALVVVGTFPKEIATQYGRACAKSAREFSASLEGV